MDLFTGYARERDDNLYVGSSGVTLDAVLVLWQAGSTPEAIHADYPNLPLADIYGAIAYYLDHQAELDANQRQRVARPAADPNVRARMRQRLAEGRARLHPGDMGAKFYDWHDHITLSPL